MRRSSKLLTVNGEQAGVAPAGAPFPPRPSIRLAWRVYWAMVFGGVPGYAAAFILLQHHRAADAALAAAAGSLLGYGAAALLLGHSFRRAANLGLGDLFRSPGTSEFILIAATTAVLVAANHIYALALGIPVRPLAAPATMGEAERGLYIGLVAATAIVAGPWVEEVLFRGLVFRAFEQRVSPSAALIASAFIFALAHGSWSFLPTHFLSGFAFAAAYRRTNNLSVALLMHAAYNALALLF